MSVPGAGHDRLAVNRYAIDEAGSHIVVHQEAARRAGAAPLLRRVCPAGVYAENPDGTIAVEYAGCLECGACLAVAPPGTLTWRQPRGGFGVAYREG